MEIYVLHNGPSVITGQMLGQNIADSFKRDMIQGNTATRAHWLTYATMSIAGTKGATSGVKGVSKATSAAAKEMKEAAKTLQDKVQGLNLGPKPAFDGVHSQIYGTYKLPDNVNLKDQVMMQSKAGELPGAKGIDNVKPGDTSSLAPGGGLAAHELKGGHLIDRHVGKTDEELLERIRNNPKITGSSSFNDRMTAEKVADTVLRDPKNIEKIQRWISDPNSRPTLPLKFKGDGETIGRSATRNSEVIENVTNAKIILKKDNDGGFILTGYPVK